MRLDPLVDRGAFEAPVGTNLKAGEFSTGSVLVDGQRLHAEVLGQFLNCKNTFFSAQGFLPIYSLFMSVLVFFEMLVKFICWLIFCQWFVNKFIHFDAILYMVPGKEFSARDGGFMVKFRFKLIDIIYRFMLILRKVRLYNAFYISY